MQVLRVRNVHDALRQGLFVIANHGVTNNSRAGEVLVFPEPVCTVYEKPEERVLFWQKRDANPYFHFMEGLWMLSGRDDVDWISQFSANIAQFSDDQKTLHGAYGKRWIDFFKNYVEVQVLEETKVEAFSINQLHTIIEILKQRPNDRRCVLQMWHCEEDLNRAGKDVPCNTHIYFKISLEGKLDMTVLCRSNDIIWGAYGANAVHMSMLQEYMAASINAPIGVYRQVSNDWHAYTEVFHKTQEVLKEKIFNPYTEGEVSSFPMVNGPIKDWEDDLKNFMHFGANSGYKDKFFRRVASPLWASWFTWKDKQNPKRIEDALQQLDSCSATDWRKACQEWLIRRKGNK